MKSFLVSLFLQAQAVPTVGAAVVGLACLVWLASQYIAKLRAVSTRVFDFLIRHIFVTHLVGMIILSILSLTTAIGLKPWVLESDPGARPYDESLLQKLPITLSCLLVLFVMAFVIIRITMPAQYDYLNFSNKKHGPEQDFNELTPWARLLISLGFLCFIVFCGVLLFTGNL